MDDNKPMNDNKQYKVWLIDAGEIVKKVIVFMGNEETHDVFSEDEQDEIKDIINTDNVIFSTDQLHKDDSIEQIKYKIAKVLKCKYNELYLFCFKQRTINVLNALMSSTKSVIDNDIFQQFVNNLDMDGIKCDIKNADTKKEVYEYKYLSSLGFNKECQMSIKTSLGIEFKHGYNYLFSPNPFLNKLDSENATIEKSIYLNDNKLMGDIDTNNIYVCLADDVFKYAGEDKKDSYSNIYFPNFYDDEDKQEDEGLLNNRQTL